MRSSPNPDGTSSPASRGASRTRSARSRPSGSSRRPAALRRRGHLAPGGPGDPGRSRVAAAPPDLPRGQGPGADGGDRAARRGAGRPRRPRSRRSRRRGRDTEASLSAAETEIDAELAEVTEARADARRAGVGRARGRVRAAAPVSTDGVAVAKLLTATCQGCFLSLAPAEIDEIRRAPADASSTAPTADVCWSDDPLVRRGQLRVRVVGLPQPRPRLPAGDAGVDPAGRRGGVRRTRACSTRCSPRWRC